MGNAVLKKTITEEEYFSFCEQNEGKFEFYAGEIFSMAGAMPDHNAVASAIAGEIYAQIKGRGCRIYQSDQRLHIISAGLFTFPDISVYCDPPEYSPARRDTLINPLLVIEVLSDSTEGYDRGAKFSFYQKIPSLKEYVMAASNDKIVEVYTRQGSNSWKVTYYSAENPAIVLNSLGITLMLEDLYSMIIVPVFDRNPGQ